jgi:hypothetical protein
MPRTNEADGAAKQEALVAFAKRSGMKIAGPQRHGQRQLHRRYLHHLRQSFQPGEKPQSRARTQSGNMCATVFRIARRAGVNFSQVINTGNEASVELSVPPRPASRRRSAHDIGAICYVEELRGGPEVPRRRRAGSARPGKLPGRSTRSAPAKKGAPRGGHPLAQPCRVGRDSRPAYDAAAISRAPGWPAPASCRGAWPTSPYPAHAGRTGIAGSNCAILSDLGAAGAILAGRAERSPGPR